MSKRRRLGVRAMRQRLSAYLRRAERGETFEVTSHGRPVAMLGPLPEGLTPLERLLAGGRAEAPEGDLVDLGVPPAARGRSLSRALQEQRGERL